MLSLKVVLVLGLLKYLAILRHTFNLHCGLLNFTELYLLYFGAFSHEIAVILSLENLDHLDA